VTWLIACERSGVMRDAFLAVGIDAVSCDLMPTRVEGPHIQGDALEQIGRRWAGVIAHPTCRYLTNAGVKHLYRDGRKENGRYEPRWADMRAGAVFFNAFKTANAPCIAIENPIAHGHALALIGRPSQVVQPWWFGDKAFKATCFWLYGLDKLEKTHDLILPEAGTPEWKRWSAVHRMAPSADREEKRSQTFPNLARAVAWQWGHGCFA